MSILSREAYCFRVHAEGKMEEMNNVDPDDGNRWVCNACRLPIFSSPFVACDGDDSNSLVMHTQCANELPVKIEGHLLHQEKELSLFVDAGNNINTTSGKRYCSRCRSICGSKYYACGDGSCVLTLDLTCALSIKIIHRSHPHKLTATRWRSGSIICNACGIQHRPPVGLQKLDAGSMWDLSYVCIICDFWIHPDCALLPNVIVVEKYHSHPLLLSYANTRDSSTCMIFDVILTNNECAICEGKSEGIGWYECLHCGYTAHVKCVLHSNPRQVLLKDAHVPGLLRLPMPDEHQNLMASIMKTYEDTTSTSTSTTTDHGASTSTSTSTTHVDGDSEDTNVHEHPLIFHDHCLHNDGDDIAARVCNVCVRLVSLSDPFYSCHEASCRDFIVHECCAHLPSTLINQTLSSLHSTGNCGQDLQTPLSLLWKPKPLMHDDPFNIFTLSVGLIDPHPFNGFLYSCIKDCGLHLDVVSALMPASITHDAHSKSHILRKKKWRTTDITCSFCGKPIYSYLEISYECNNGCDFIVHAECAILPGTVTHDFDRHPLKLMPHNLRQPQKEEEIPFCEICEIVIGDRGCHYGCSICKQVFHTGCFPYFDRLSMMKFGFTVRVKCHGCPLTCVRAHPLIGYRCGHCNDAITEWNEIAFECADCYFRMHRDCVEKLIISKS